MKNISLKYIEQHHAIANIPLDHVEESEQPPDTSCSNDFPSYETMLMAVERLPKGYRKIFKLAVLEGLSHKEIGMLLNIAPHSSSSQLSRAKDLLRKLLSRYYIATVLFILLIICLRHLLYAPKGIVGTSRQMAIKPKAGQEAENASLEDGVNAVPIRASCQYANIQPTTKKTCGQSIVSQDNNFEQKDSVQSFGNTTMKDQKIKIEEGGTTHPAIVSQIPPNNKKGWSLAFSYSGVNKQTNVQKTTIPGITSAEKPQEVVNESYHHIPIILSLSFSKKFDERWGFETGAQYTRLHSDFTAISDFYLKEKQKISYIGIPLKGTFDVYNKQKMSIYLSAGATLDIPIKATSESIKFDKSGQATFFERKEIHPSLQWSTNLGIGIQYQITPSVGIYAEPNLNYYFNNGDGIKTIRTEKPFNVALPIGIRLSW